MPKKLSGAEFRKKAKERDEKNEQFLSKVPKISGFFLPRDKQPCSVEGATSSKSNVLASGSQKPDYVVKVKVLLVTVLVPVLPIQKTFNDNLKMQS